MVQLPYEQRDKLTRIGGARFIRKMIDEHIEHKPTWKDDADRKRQIVMDIRPAKIVGRLYGVSAKTVAQYRFTEKLKGRPVAELRKERVS